MECTFFNLADKPELIDIYEGMLPRAFGYLAGQTVMTAEDSEGNPVGVLIYSKDSYIVDITWLYVVPEARNQGVGRDLVEELIGFYLDDDEVPEVTCRFPDAEELSSLKAFFEADDRFNLEAVGNKYSVSPKTVNEAPRIKKLCEAAPGIKDTLFTLPGNVLHDFLQSDKLRSGYFVYDRETWETEIAKDLCFCHYDGKKVTSCIIVSRLSEDRLCVEYMYGLGTDDLRALLMAAFKEYTMNYKDCSLEFEVFNPKVEELVKELFGDDIENRKLLEAVWNYEW